MAHFRASQNPIFFCPNIDEIFKYVRASISTIQNTVCKSRTEIAEITINKSKILKKNASAFLYFFTISMTFQFYRVYNPDLSCSIFQNAVRLSHNFTKTCKTPISRGSNEHHIWKLILFILHIDFLAK